MCFFLKACMQYDKKAKLSVRFFFANDKKLKSREQKKRQQQKPEIKMKQANQNFFIINGLEVQTKERICQTL